jgi:small-conductance mechanosensitive channel
MFFLVGLIILTSTVMSLIRVGGYHYKANLDTKEEQDRLDPIIKSVQRFAYFIVLIVALSFGLAHFGVDTNTLLLILLVTSLIVLLAARDVIADALSGFIILVDQPFRQGDSVLIKELNTWGDVLDIGIRTTRIRTKDNRELIVPNSQVAKSQIVNYNFPDSKYRLQTDVGVAYGIDIDRIRKTATDAVRGVKYVLDDEQVDVFFIEFGDSARKIRVRWWIATFHDEWPALDEVNVALESAFEKANIEMPYETYALRVHMEDGGSKVSRPKLSASGEDLKADHE